MNEEKGSISKFKNKEDEKYKVFGEYKNTAIEDKLELIQNNIDKISTEVFRNYLSKIDTLYEPKKLNNNFNADNRIRFVNITRYVIDEKENNIDKLKNVYNVLSESECNIALIFDRNQIECNIYLAICNKGSDDDIPIADGFLHNIEAAMLGNFPGTTYNPCGGIGKQKRYASVKMAAEFRKKILSKRKSTISMTTNIASEKSEDFVSQSIEKLIDGYIPENEDEEYIMILLAEPKKQNYIEELKKMYCNYFTILSPFSSWEEVHSYSDTINLMENVTKGKNINVGIPCMLGAGVNYTKSLGENRGNSKTRGLTLSYTLYEVKKTLERIESQIKRLEECEALGMWDFATYVLSNDYTTSVNVAKTYKSLTQGNNSHIEKAAINTWNGHIKEQKDCVDRMKESLAMFFHPEFQIKENDKLIKLPDNVNGCTCISGVELARAMSLPKRSVQGFPVVKCAEFGRDVLSFDTECIIGDIEIGCINHMHRKERKKTVKLNKESLAAHTFITGSTGSGKSNTIYKILSELDKENVKFLVIEPAKGEYKNIFGGRNDVSVYGTNPNKTSLLRLNPFSFPEDIHILEHIDRLIEIFNACWPMYAAMPAILKDAVEKVYKNKGWSLTKSICIPRKFPTFYDLIEELPKVIYESEYSTDTKGDYIGALSTRIKSLTNGINGQIFCSSLEISNELLFDSNVIVDISRVGSMETKSLLMGIMIMKLQEYRMSYSNMNDELKHITVLEEAHNILRRTMSEQSQESSNLQGKSVEMIANAIAEMRTYGEGFIIADQSPGLMDMSVIRNTNTKIIMRLPDEEDRKLVGKAAALNDNQIIELSKLRCGVAAIYQNDWLEPVLCAVDLFENDKEQAYIFRKNNDVQTAITQKYFKKLLNTSDNYEFIDEEVEKIKSWIDSLNVGNYTKQIMYKSLDSSVLDQKEKETILYNIFDGKKLAIQLANASGDDFLALENLDNQIRNMYDIDDLLMAQNIRKLILNIVVEMVKGNEFQKKIEFFSLYSGGII
ncbi:ATP-binding protein [Clostridium sp. DL1XJH146]